MDVLNQTLNSFSTQISDGGLSLIYYGLIVYSVISLSAKEIGSIADCILTVIKGTCNNIYCRYSKVDQVHSILDINLFSRS